MTKTILIIASIMLGACSQQTAQDFTNAFSGIPTSKDIQNHQSKCTEMGFKKGSEVFSNCMMRLYDAHIAARSALHNQSGARTPVGQKVYDSGECIGAVIMGECHGSILPKKVYRPTCHGQMVNGQCTGALF